jgi:hypothetical protein
MNIPTNIKAQMFDLPQKAALELGALAMALAADERTRGRFLRLVAELDPNYKLPADVANEQVAY